MKIPYGKYQQTFVLHALGAAFLLSVCLSPAHAGVQGAFLYTLSDFTGPIPYSAPRVAVDKERDEVSVLFQNSVRVFNGNGMEIYHFGDELDFGGVADLAVDRDGNILMLTYSPPPESVCKIVRCNFRGEPTGEVRIKGLPAGFQGLYPNRLIYRDGKLYLAELLGLKVVVTDEEGTFKEGYDLFSLLGLKEKERGNIEIGGLSVADDGSILFTIPVFFSAYRLSPDGKITSFGRPGSGPGRFNVVGGIALDSKGDYLVVDRLKCTVMVFDKDYNYLTQFGFRGWKRGNLIAPMDIAVDRSDRVYVTQNGRRGVSVYALSRN
jgi:hypothetical protein